MSTQSTELVVQSRPDSMLSIIERAVMSPDFDVNKLAQLLEVRERWEKNEARKAFVVAMNAFKADPPEISKNKHVKFGTTEYDHATLDHVCDAVTKGLSEHGITHRWRPEQTDSIIRVTCILTHELGHSEETTLQGSADTSGSKNSIQAIASTVTYLERYTLLAATGLAATNDTDGKVNADILPKDKVREQIEWMGSARNVEELQRLFRDAYKEASDAGDKGAQDQYIKAKDARKKELL